MYQLLQALPLFYWVPAGTRDSPNGTFANNILFGRASENWQKASSYIYIGPMAKSNHALKTS